MNVQQNQFVIDNLIQNQSQSSSPYILTIDTNDEFETYDDEIIRQNSANPNLHSPLSGSEPNYDPSIWNDRESIKNTHNCYAYALNKRASTMKDKPQPGYSSKYFKSGFMEDENYSCNAFLERLKKDSPTLYTISFKKRCKPGYNKSFMTITTDPINRDYHFYRLDANGFWSHKPGRTEVIDVDASGKKIKNPLIADRKYAVFDYDKPCFFFCVNPKTSRVRSSG